nr:hypothetical protein [Thermoanaerobaculia bacterium]
MSDPTPSEPEFALELSLADLAEALEESAWLEEPERRAELELCQRYEQEAQRDRERKEKQRELPTGLDPNDLAQTGWAVIYPKGKRGERQEALHRLLERRGQQAGELFRELSFTPGQDIREFLWREAGESAGTIDVRKLPYYVLLAGNPEELPFELQYQLAINHAVGRLDFDDLNDFHRYSEHLVATERDGARRQRKLGIFAVEDSSDPTLETLSRHLVDPLGKRLAGYHSWDLLCCRGAGADRQALENLLSEARSPGVLLVASHGAGCSSKGSEQKALQGALELRTAGPAGGGLMPSTFSAAELPREADLGGLIAFLFACWGAGTPRKDNFPFVKNGRARLCRLHPDELSDQPFVAALPKKLLAQGAQAVVGHVDRGWTLSFAWVVNKVVELEAVRSLEDSLKQLLDGARHRSRGHVPDGG